MMIKSNPTFWAKESRSLLWHMVEEGERVSMCEKPIPPPRMSMRAEPPDDARCAKCDKFILREEEYD